MLSDLNGTVMDCGDSVQDESTGEIAKVIGSAESDLVLERGSGERIFAPRSQVRLYRKARRPTILTQENGP